MKNKQHNKIDEALRCCHTHEFQRAIILSDEYISESPDNELIAIAQQVRMYALAGLSQFDDAVDAANIALQYKPNNIGILAQRALILRKQGDLDASEQDCRKVLEFDSENTHIHGELALIALGNEDYDRAIEESTIVIDSDVEKEVRADALSSRANAYMKLGDTNNAMDDINKAMNVWPENAAIYYGIRSDLHMANRNIEAAAADIDAGLRMNPTKPELLFRKGRTLGARGDFASAIPYLSAAISADPNAQLYEECLCTRAVAYIHINLQDNALQDIDRVLGMNPRSDMAITLRREIERG